MAISKKSYMGVALEAIPGTAITTPTLYVPTKSLTKSKKKREFLMEERGDRNDQYDVIDTTRWGEWDAKGNFYHDAHLYFLIAGMGSDTPTQPNAGTAPTVWKHTMALADVPKTLTLYKSYDAAVYYHPYSCVEKFDFKFSSDGKLLEFDTSGKSLWPTKYGGAPLTPAFSTVKPFAGYLPTITLSGGASADIDELSLAFEQKVTLWTPAAGSPDWTTAYYGGRKVSGSFTARFDSDTLYNFYRNGVNDSLLIDFMGSSITGKNYTVSLGTPSAGTFVLTYGGQTTATIAYNAASSAVQTALTALTSVGVGNATVSGSAGGPYTVSFINSLANDGNALTGNGAALTGGTFSVVSNTNYKNELNINIPVISYDEMDHDLGKENVLIKCKFTGLATGSGAGNNLLQIFAINTVASYSV